MGAVAELTDTDFDQYVLQSDVPVLVDFWSTSCAPCRALVPILEDMVAENEGDAKIAKVNVTNFPMLAAKYGVEMLPTLLFFQGGKVVERMVGLQSKDKLQDALDEIE